MSMKIKTSENKLKITCLYYDLCSTSLKGLAVLNLDLDGMHSRRTATYLIEEQVSAWPVKSLTKPLST